MIFMKFNVDLFLTSFVYFARFLIFNLSVCFAYKLLNFFVIIF